MTVTGRRITAAGALLVLVGAGILWARWQPVSAPPVPPASPPPASPSPDTVRLEPDRIAAAGIATATVRPVARSEQLEAPGVLAIDATLTARIGATVDGKVLTVHAQVGDRVQAGQVLAEIHSRIVHEARAEYQKALAARRRAAAELTYAIEADERARRLFAEKAVSLQEVQRTRVDRDLAVQALDMAETEVRRARAVLDNLGIAEGPEAGPEDRILVRSPITGAVLERHITDGTAVTVGTLLFVVSDLSNLWALAEVAETALPLLRPGAPVAVRVAAYPADTFAGTVVFVGDTLDPTTRRVTVRCSVPNQDGRLKPNMFATISFETTTTREVLAVPESAVQELHGTPAVFVTADGTTFTVRPVRVGARFDGHVEILGGLAAGERVAATGTFLLKSELVRAPGGEPE